MVGSGLAVKYLSLSAFFYVLAASFLVTTAALLIIVGLARGPRPRRGSGPSGRRG
jgi:hypothetical protein